MNYKSTRIHYNHEPSLKIPNYVGNSKWVTYFLL